ncbi:hypothetical protein [Pontibacter akesuensis]|uniref:Uncharacterized protein n=1 Tax=Pontibacter akesuensis TaxID=388950 RepID=A0A1I7J647_9BACT|nr:hypothetical protein [Pontibacter akesuensis]GHA72223.1 hypothetical protein GCM10007389_27410 [Pontibacter akesuensis]SFU80592.1 hypothetical protein SAMN04487941_2522 [Pontibacter akesuensis]
MNIRGIAKTASIYFDIKYAILLVVLFFCITISANGQHYKLLNLSEKQVRDEVRNYHSVIRDSSEHEFATTLIFKDKNNEVQLRLNFFGGKSYQVECFSAKESFDSAIKTADKLYDKIGDNYWRDKDKKFEVRIFSIQDKVITSYNRGVSRY